MAERKGCGVDGAFRSVKRLTRLILVLVCLSCTALWAGWLSTKHMAGRGSILDRAEALTVDWRLLISGPLEPPTGLVIIAIDDATVSSEGQYPLARDRLALLVDAIRKAGARGLAMDMLLLDKTDPVADQALETALAAIPTVIAGAALFEGGPQRTQPLPIATGTLRPLARFDAVAQVGLVNIVTDAGGTPRHMPLVISSPNGPEPTFAMQAAGLSADVPPSLTKNGVRMAGVVLPLDLGWHVPLRPYGAGGHIPTISAQTLLRENAQPVDLHGKLVVIGATATGVGDRFSTVYDPIMPGVEVLATGIANLTQTTALIRDTRIRRIDAAVAMGLAIIIVLILFFMPLTLGMALSFALLAIWLGGISLMFDQRFWFNAILPLVAALPPAAATILIRQSIDRRHAKILTIARAELSRFQAPAMAQMIAKDPTFLAVPVAQQAAILFVDLSGFTGLGERLGPADTRSFLKTYHTKIVEVCDRHNGVVLDFMGDGAMIGFGIPEQGPNDASNALRGAIDLARTLNVWIKSSDVSADIGGLRVGAHIGPVILSRLGHERQQQIAATGDCVNVASRLMDVGKDLDAVITASAELVKAAGGTAVDLPPSAEKQVPIRGRQQEITVALWRASDLIDEAQK